MNPVLADRTSRARLILMDIAPFWGTLVLKLRIRVATPEMQIKTAGVTRDGTLYICESYLESLSQPELVGLLAHEAGHLAFFCFERQGQRHLLCSFPAPEGVFHTGRTDKTVACPVCKAKAGHPCHGAPMSLWNVAHDFAVNDVLDGMFKGTGGKAALHPSWLLSPKYHEWNGEAVYDDLAGCNGGDGDGDGDGLVIYIPGDGEGIGADMRPDLPGETEDGQKAVNGDGEARERLRRKVERDILEASLLHEKQRGRGTLPAGLQKMIDDLRQPRVPWMTALARFIGERGKRQDFSYRRISRRSRSAGVILPAVVRDGVEVAVLWDTSGSMNGREGDILPEIDSLAQDMGMGVRVVVCDASVHADIEDVKDALDLISQGAVRGGGGSDFTPAFDALEETNYKGVVVAFTDGAIGVPVEKPTDLQDVLWVLGPGDVDPTDGRWGCILRVDEEGFVERMPQED